MSDKKIMLHSKDLGNGRYEVCGVIFYAKSHADAIGKYTRNKKAGRKPSTNQLGLRPT